MTEKMKTYLIVFQNGKEQKITVPESWKVTFGPAVAGVNSSKNPGYKMPMALRFYESKEKQRAIFTDVSSFRDMEIKIEEKLVKREEKDGYMECDGVRKRTVFSAQVSEWIDPDRSLDLPALPDDREMYKTSKMEKAHGMF